MKHWLFILPTIFIFLSCQTPVKTQKRTERTKDAPTSPSTPLPPLETETDDSDVENNPAFPPAAPAPVVTGATEKWALILGPGGALAMGHVGVLRQLQKQKVEPNFIVGVEWASPIAALYSLSGTSQAIDWQLNKLKDDDLPGSSSWFVDSSKISVKKYSSWLNEAFQSKKADSTRVGFLCPSFNTQKKTTYIMNKGELREMVQFCWPYPPTLQSSRNAVAAPMALAAVSNYLRRQGVQKIILVNVLGNDDVIPVREEDRDLLWAQILEEYSTPGAKAQGVDDVISLNFGSIKPTDFKRRKEIIEQGEQKSSDQIQKLIKKYRL